MPRGSTAAQVKADLPRGSRSRLRDRLHGGSRAGPSKGDLAPPLIDGVTLAEQGGALVAGKVLPGVEAFFGYRRQQRPAGDDRFGKFAAQAAPAGFLLGELVDDDERDVVDGARDR